MMCARGGEAAAAVVVVENEAESVPVPVPESRGPNDLDTCPVCLLNFHSREPKLLPCLHSFCKKCLPSPSRNLATSEPPNSHSDSATKPLNVIRCPVCRQECMEVDVMENVFVKDSVEAPSSTVERTAQLCMTCDDNMEAAGFCVDCVEYLCATCVEAHQRVKFTKDHTIRQKTDVSREVSTQRPMFCDNHKQEPLKLFCETCDLLTCRDCQLVGHKDHNYQFLEDAYKNHRDHMESLTHQLQEKRKVIEEVSNAINNGLLQVDQNRTSVHDEIKKSICNLILEINKKGKMLVGQLEALTKDHESVLQKQQEDIGYLSRHLDHVIKFTKWATAKNGGTALLYCKRLILFQIGNLLRAKCSTSFIPQSSVRFHCRSSYWASNVDLGSLVVESVPGHQLGGFQGIPHQLSRPGQGPSGSPYSFALGASQNTLAQLQMQVDKLNPQAHWQPQPPPPPWTWYQSVRLQRTVPGTLQAGSPSHCMPPQAGRRILMPPHNHISPTSSLPSPGFAPQPLRGSSSSLQAKPADVFSSSPLYGHVTQLPCGAGRESSPQTHQMMESTYLNKRNDSPLYTLQPNYPQNLAPSLPHRSVQGHQYAQGYSIETQDEKPGTVCWKPQEMQETSGAAASAHKKRRRSSPGPVIVIKDEPDYDGSYVQASQRASLPDSTGDQTQTSAEDEGNKDPSPPQSAEKTLQSPLHPLSGPQGQSETATPKRNPSAEGEQQADPHRARLEDREASCAVCQSAGELQGCEKCSRAFHLTCHVPTLLNPPSGEWLCSLCRDLSESDCDGKAEAKTVKKEPACEGGFSPEDKQKCERLLLHLFCSELSSDFKVSTPPSVCANSRPAVKEALNLSAVKKRLESVSYQSAADLIADIRLIFGSCVTTSETDTEVSASGRKLKVMFEEHLRSIFPDQTFPEIKVEVEPPAPPDSQFSSLDDISQVAKRQRTFSPNCSKGEE